jgi:hypothetical protein
VDCPFRAFERLLGPIQEQTSVVIVDLHAEATSEKVAFGKFVSGKASLVFGTHTHIQTADDRILPQGTAYITDLGMTGPYDSVIGQDTQKIIRRFLTGIPERFEVAKGDPWLYGALVEIDAQSGKATHITRLQRSLP